ncbi:MAG: hypothetical protein QXZ06_01800 [Candidatus Jordarchaeales archaeon]
MLETKSSEILAEKFLDKEELLRRIELGVFPRPTQRRAVKSLFSLVWNLRSSLESLPPSSSTKALVEKGYELLQAICDLIEKIERSNVHYTSLGAVYLAEYLTGKAGEEAVPIICFQSYTSSHSRLSDILKLAAPLLPPESRELKEEVLFFTLPYFLRNDPLSHCLVARELALHMIESKRLLEETLTGEGSSKKLLIIAADRLASLMVGPAYLFTLTNFGASLASDVKERIRNIAALLADEGYYEEELLSGSLPPLEELRSSTGIERLHEIEESFRKTAAYYPPEVFECEVPQLVSRLLELLPPNEVTLPDKATRPAEIPSIINAGWIVKQRYMPTFCNILKVQDPEGKYQAKKKLAALIEKAIELSIIHKSLLEAEI